MSEDRELGGGEVGASTLSKCLREAFILQRKLHSLLPNLVRADAENMRCES